MSSMIYFSSQGTQKGPTRLLTLNFHQHSYHNQGALLVWICASILAENVVLQFTISYSTPHLQNRWSSKEIILNKEYHSSQPTVDFCTSCTSAIVPLFCPLFIPFLLLFLSPIWGSPPKRKVKTVMNQETGIAGHCN